MKKYILQSLAVAVFSFCTVSCTDYLDIVPDDVATIDKSFNNRAAAEHFFFNCYSYLPNPTDRFTTPELMGGDEYWWNIDNSSEANRDINHLASGRQNTNDPYLNFWNGSKSGKNLFVGIRDCNIFLENIDRVPDIDDYEKVRWISEVKFLKAYYHYYLMSLYGPIPIIRENLPVSASPSEVRVYREPVDDVVAYINELLDEATINQLPLAIEDRTNEMGRITQPIAYALKAKAMVWAASPLFNGNTDYEHFVDNQGRKLVDTEYKEQKWKDAALALKKAIDICKEAGHDLYTYRPSIVMSDVTALKLTLRGTVSERWNKEIIWGSTRDGGLAKVCMPRLFIKNIGNSTNNNGVTMNVAEDFYTENGIPINEDPTWNYDHRYEMQVITEDERLNMEVGEKTAKFNFKREPRFYATLGFDRGAFEGAGKLQDNDLYYLHARKGESAGYRSVGEHFPTGYFVKKVIHHESTPGTEKNTYSGVRYAFPIIRLADLYLLYAEALNEITPTPNAAVYEYIDLVRARAGLKGVVESWEKSNLSSKPQTKEGMREIIHQERLIELAGEGQRFHDLRRWKKAIEYWNKPILGWNYNAADAEEYYTVVNYMQRELTLKYYLWPIKTYDITVNSNLVQNPGW